VKEDNIHYADDGPMESEIDKKMKPRKSDETLHKEPDNESMGSDHKWSPNHQDEFDAD
jgi:hypothetical protein